MNFICVEDCKEAVSQTTRCIIKSVDISERRDMKICSDFFGSGGSPCSESNCGVFRQHQEAIDIKVTRNVIYIQPNIHSRKGAVQSHDKVLHNSSIFYSKLQYTNTHTNKQQPVSHLTDLFPKKKHQMSFTFSNAFVCEETHFSNVANE